MEKRSSRLGIKENFYNENIFNADKTNNKLQKTTVITLVAIENFTSTLFLNIKLSIQEVLYTLSFITKPYNYSNLKINSYELNL